MTANARPATGPVYLTPAGMQRYRLRIADAHDAYLAVCRSNEDAAGAGDSSVWHDNFAYEENQRQMHQLAARVRELEELVARARVVRPPAEPGDRVRIGVSVRVVTLDDGRESVWFIAGWDDGDPAEGRLSYNSPLGSALVGAEEGDLVVARIAGRERELEILEVLPAPAEERA